MEATCVKDEIPESRQMLVTNAHSMGVDSMSEFGWADDQFVYLGKEPWSIAACLKFVAVGRSER
jgi:hypothetical protein